MATGEVAVRANEYTGKDGGPILSVRDLSIRLSGVSQSLLRDISFDVDAGERVAIVGESGSGKTLTGLTILGLLPQVFDVAGRIEFLGRDLLTLSERELRRVRGGQIGMIFQEPMTALDPVFTVGEQIAESVRLHLKVSKSEARNISIEALRTVGIALPERRYGEYPHQLSGGMRQRVAIAIALACRPALIIADEPTTALDVTVQAQVVELIRTISDEFRTAVLFITHDIGVASEACDRILTFYAGDVVEDGSIDDVLEAPGHPYTSALLRSIPRRNPPKTRLPAMRGRVPSAHEMPEGCRFAQRCDHVQERCAGRQDLLTTRSVKARCCRTHELRLPGVVR